MASPTPTTTDRVLRSITNDGSFRVVATRTDATVRGAVAAQGLLGPTAELFGELVTGAILVRETMAPQFRVQLSLGGRGGRGRIEVDAFPGGDTRGRVVLPEDGAAIDVGAGSIFRLFRAITAARMHEGVVLVPAGGGVSETLMTYMQESEQVFSVLAVAVTDAPEGVRAGGYLVQLLPEYSRAVLATMVSRLEKLPPLGSLLRDGATARSLSQRILAEFPSSEIEETTTRYACRCSQERAESVLAGFARGELELALSEGRTLEARCDFCHACYRLDAAQIGRLLEGRAAN